MHNALVIGGMNAYVWWYIRRSYGPMKENGNISKRGYMMAQFSKYIRPGAVRVDATEFPANDVYVSAYKNADGKVVVIAINHSNTSYSQQFNVSGKTIKSVNRYRTSQNENLVVSKNLALTGNGWWAQLNAKTVQTFVLS
jgi:glucuronoarabinoxylan endo-1,4-beta-xylanase